MFTINSKSMLQVTMTTQNTSSKLLSNVTAEQPRVAAAGGIPLRAQRNYKPSRHRLLTHVSKLVLLLALGACGAKASSTVENQIEELITASEMEFPRIPEDDRNKIKSKLKEMQIYKWDWKPLSKDDLDLDETVKGRRYGLTQGEVIERTLLNNDEHFAECSDQCGRCKLEGTPEGPPHATKEDCDAAGCQWVSMPETNFPTYSNSLEQDGKCSKCGAEWGGAFKYSIITHLSVDEYYTPRSELIRLLVVQLGNPEVDCTDRKELAMLLVKHCSQPELDTASGKWRRQKEYTFATRPLGLNEVHDEKHNGIIVGKVTNPGCLRQGIVDGSQLLSVNNKPVSTHRSFAEEIKRLKEHSCRITMSFKRPMYPVGEPLKMRITEGKELLGWVPVEVVKVNLIKKEEHTYYRFDVKVLQSVLAEERKIVGREFHNVRYEELLQDARCPLCNGEDAHPEARPREEPQPDDEDACARCRNVRYVTTVTAESEQILRRRLSAAEILGKGSQGVPRVLAKVMAEIKEAEEAH